MAGPGMAAAGGEELKEGVCASRAQNEAFYPRGRAIPAKPPGIDRFAMGRAAGRGP